MKTFSAILLAAALANRLPTGAMLDPISAPKPVGNFPLALVAAPDGKQLVALLCGWRQQGLQVIDRESGAVTQTITQPAAFIGLTFSPDGKTLFTSGGNSDVVHVYRWENGRAIDDGIIRLHEAPKPKTTAVGYPAGLACSPDGRFLYVAENLGDAVSVIDIAQRTVLERDVTDRYPYAVAVDATHVYVSAWGDSTVDAFARGENGLLSHRTRIGVSRHPSALLLHGGRLFATSATSDRIDIIDPETGHVTTLDDSAPAGPHEGSTPNALALSNDGNRLFVAEADNNAVAVFDLQSNQLLGRIPTDWYPTALERVGSTIYVACAKGHGTAPNPGRPQPLSRMSPTSHDYTLGQLDGSIVSFGEDIGDLGALSKRVADANGWTSERAGTAAYPPFKHVIYIIKENRTYDQVFGDMPEGDGDRSLVFFDQSDAPNHHALARRFGLFDRFFVNAEVSADGHNWSTAAYASDYVEKTVQAQYSGRGRDFDYQGTNRGHLSSDEDDVNAPSTGYLWDLAVRKGISLRDYGEFVVKGAEVGQPQTEIGTKAALLPNTDPNYVGWDLDVRDQKRVDAWLEEFNRYVAGGNLPALEIMSLPNDHTYGAAAGKPTPRAYMADNDLALGRIVDALSHSPYWRDTVVFVLEDDAQSGPDHVDSHRSVFLAISAYSHAGTVHRFVNTTDVLATIEEILGLGQMSQFDYFGRPLRGLFTSKPDLRPYSVLKPGVPLDELNPPSHAAKESAKLDFSKPDAADDDDLNRILWAAVKGEKVPYPAPRRAPTYVGN